MRGELCREKFSAWAEGSDPPECINALWEVLVLICYFHLSGKEFQIRSRHQVKLGEKSQGPHARGWEEEVCSGSSGQN